jgi:hypothetical protein
MLLSVFGVSTMSKALTEAPYICGGAGYGQCTLRPRECGRVFSRQLAVRFGVCVCACSCRGPKDTGCAGVYALGFHYLRCIIRRLHGRDLRCYASVNRVLDTPPAPANFFSSLPFSSTLFLYPTTLLFTLLLCSCIVNITTFFTLFLAELCSLAAHKGRPKTLSK